MEEIYQDGYEDSFEANLMQKKFVAKEVPT